MAANQSSFDLNENLSEGTVLDRYSYNPPIFFLYFGWKCQFDTSSNLNADYY